MKHCINCRYFRPKPDSTPQYGLCTHHKARREQSSDKFITWLVIGSEDAPPDDVSWSYATTMRGFYCGVDARLFEARTDTDPEAAAERRKDHDFAAKGQQ